MTTTGFIIALAIIAVLFFIVYVREQRGQNEHESENTFPSGKEMLSDSEMLALSLEELRTWDNDDLRWLINYVGHQMGSEDEKKMWDDLFINASRALYNY